MTKQKINPFTNVYVRCIRHHLLLWFFVQILDNPDLYDKTENRQFSTIIAQTTLSLSPFYLSSPNACYKQTNKAIEISYCL